MLFPRPFRFLYFAAKQLEYGENDGTNDVRCKLPLYEYRYLEEARTETVTQNNGRTSDAAGQPETAGSYTVQRGDSLWAICRKIYGDGSLAYQLATANGIRNPNLIYPGQVLTLPDKAALAGYAATPAPSSPAKTAAASPQPEQRAPTKAGSSDRVTRELAILDARRALGLPVSAGL